MTLKNWIKWLLIRNGSKIVTYDCIDSVQTVRQKLSCYKGVTTHEWNGKILYSMNEIRFATKQEIKTGKRL